MTLITASYLCLVFLTAQLDTTCFQVGVFVGVWGLRIETGLDWIGLWLWL